MTERFTTNDQKTELKSALAAFETSLSTPIVSGELAAWIEDVQTTSEAACNLIRLAAMVDHPRQYEEMAEQDSELLPKIEALKAEDEALVQECEHLGKMAARDAQHVPKLEPDEGKAQKHVQHLIDDGMSLVVRARKHEVAVETWLMEAFNRDRGTAD